MRLRLNDQAVLCVEIMLDIASWVTQQIFAISMPAICHNRRTTTFYNFSTTFEAKRMAQEDTRRMKKISRIEYCAGFEPLQSGMEQDEGSRILLPTMKPLDWRIARKPAWNLGLWEIRFTTVTTILLQMKILGWKDTGPPVRWRSRSAIMIWSWTNNEREFL